MSESCACTSFSPRRRHVGSRTGPRTRMCTHGHHRAPVRATYNDCRILRVFSSTYGPGRTVLAHAPYGPVHAPYGNAPYGNLTGSCDPFAKTSSRNCRNPVENPYTTRLHVTRTSQEVQFRTGIPRITRTYGFPSRTGP